MADQNHREAVVRVLEQQRQRDPNRVMREVAPINWGRAIWSGMLAAAIMLLFVDVMNMFGATPFSFEQYVGSMFQNKLADPRNWIWGFGANLMIGAAFGLLYAYMFEYVYRRANVGLGLLLGLLHAAFAAVAVFPFFNSIHDQMGIVMFPSFGVLGASLGLGTFIAILVGHLIFGTLMGACYGPVRVERLHALYFEPGDSSAPIQLHEKTDEEDPREPRNRMVI